MLESGGPTAGQREPSRAEEMKLYIDDIRECPDDSWTLCRSNLEAIRVLDSHGPAVTAVSLDHDISHPIDGAADRTCPCRETFEVTARYIAMMKRQQPDWQPAITIHTSNPSGAEAMEAVLKAVGLRPTIRLQPAAERN